MALEAGINYFDMAASDSSPFEAFGRAAAGSRKQVYYQIHFGADYSAAHTAGRWIWRKSAAAWTGSFRR